MSPFRLLVLGPPERAAAYISTTTGSAAMLSIVENQVITAVVNPKNLKPDALRDSTAFFSQREVLDRVPMALTTYAAMTIGLQVAGYLLLSSPPEPPPHDSDVNSTAVDGQSGGTIFTVTPIII